MILAQQVMGVEVGTLVAVATALGVLFAIWRKVNSAEDAIAKRVQRLIIADSALAEKRGTPQPLIVEMAREFVTVSDFRKQAEKHDGDLAAITARLETLRAESAAEGSRRAASIHKRVDELSREVSATTAAAELSHGSLVELGRKVDQLILALRRDHQ